jgi:hypothetical protein
VRGAALHLTIERGLDRGTTVLYGGPGERLALDGHGVTAELWFEAGRPRLRAAAGLSLNGHRVAHGDVQLVRGDQLVIDGHEIEVG